MKFVFENYVRLIWRLGGRLRPVVTCTPLPKIGDNFPMGKVANQRKANSATRQEPTALPICFNAAIENQCKSLSITYVNCDHNSISPTRLVCDEL